ncbi:MAG: branched-chain amino acid ABC transporter permease, partial [Conexivisphaerales archaeon]
ALIILATLLFSKLVSSPFLTLSLVLATIYMGLAMAWDFSSGLTGYINFGVSFFFGIGAFLTGFLSFVHHIPIGLTILADLTLGISTGALFSVPTLRLRGPFFTLLSLLLPYIASSFILSFWTVLGLPTIGYYNIGRLAPSTFDELVLVSLFDLIILATLYALYRSHFGLVLRSIRDDEEAALNLGIRTFRYKALAFSIAAGVMAAMGGAYSSVSTFAGIDAFGLTFLLFPMLIAIVGGVKRILGSVPASYLVIVLSQYLNLYIGSATLVVFATLAIALVLITQPMFLQTFLRRRIKFE